MTDGWIYYNHAIIPTCAPHEAPNLSSIIDGSIWKGIGKKAVFARWTTEYDNSNFSDWWYIIQDKPIDLETMKKSHRRKVKKGLSNFDCRIINPIEYADRMADITLKAWGEYPVAYRPSSSREQLVSDYSNNKYLTFGCFNHDGQLCGFDRVEDCDTHWLLAQGKTDPEYERGYELNAAMTYTEIQYLKDDIERGKYLTNGQRNILHQTNFNEDLCHYYGFRKVFCKLNIAYNPKYKWIIKLAYPFRKIIAQFKGIRLVSLFCHILLMEEIVRKQG